MKTTRSFTFFRFTLAAAGATLLACMAFTLHLPSKRYLITDFGAKGDSLTMNTAAIQSAIDKCSADGGGTLVVPQGIFISGAIYLKKGVSLQVEKNGVLKGSADQKDYQQINTRWEGEERLWTSAFVNVLGVDNISITGPGTIDGSGDLWVKRAGLGRPAAQAGAATPPAPGTFQQRLGRPRMICFDKCKNVKIANIVLHNEAVWCLHILYSQKVEVQNVRIYADHNIPSSDGMDVDSSNGVHITGCDIDVNDDCISIKSGKDEDGLKVNRPAENILIEKTRFGYGHGGVAMGSETSGGIRNVEVRNCVMEDQNWAPIRFKSQPSRGGIVENITYRDIKLNNTRKAFEFDMAWRMVNPKPPAKVLPLVRNIHIINVSGTTNNVGDMHGLAGSPIDGVHFTNCNIKADKGFLIEYAKNIDLAGLKIDVKSGEPITRINAN